MANENKGENASSSVVDPDLELKGDGRGGGGGGGGGGFDYLPCWLFSFSPFHHFDFFTQNRGGGGVLP